MLKLEIFAANQGDALLLHHGTEAAPRRMLIDGGAGGTWKSALQPRLKELGAGAMLGQTLPLELIMVSHLDDDHINGILGLLRSEEDLIDSQQPRTVLPAGLWVNVFEELAASAAPSPAAAAAATAEIAIELDSVAAPESGAVIASIPQGRALRDLARKLKIPMNQPYASALVLAGVQPDHHAFEDIELHVVAPSPTRLENLRKAWTAYLEAKAKKDAEAITKSAAYLDESVYNLSSIVALVRQPRQGLADLTILLTGDARGDDILRALRTAGLRTNGTLHLNVLKVPHHGSARNLTQGFFEKVTADHYVFCSDGTDDNPDDAALMMLKAARRQGAAYHLWFSYRLDRLAKFVDDARADGHIFDATFRDDAQPSLMLDLG
jgi:beta-lactamase superfamily II metal-dependent hydrolase